MTAEEYAGQTIRRLKCRLDCQYCDEREECAHVYEDVARLIERYPREQDTGLLVVLKCDCEHCSTCEERQKDICRHISKDLNRVCIESLRRFQGFAEKF